MWRSVRTKTSSLLPWLQLSKSNNNDYEWYVAEHFYLKAQCLHILNIYAWGHDRVLDIKMRLLWAWPFISRSNKLLFFSFIRTECRTAQFFEKVSKCSKLLKCIFFSAIFRSYNIREVPAHLFLYKYVSKRSREFFGVKKR